MVGYNYDGGGSKRMTTDEREATRALGGIALIGGLTYLWLTSKPSVLPARDLTYSQEEHSKSVAQGLYFNHLMLEVQINKTWSGSTRTVKSTSLQSIMEKTRLQQPSKQHSMMVALNLSVSQKQ